MKNTFLILSILFLVLTSCYENNTTKIKTLKINPYDVKEEVALSEFIESIKYIQLETTADCILGEIAILTIGQKYIYAVESTQGIIFIFDKNGKYISKLDKYGYGPEEYQDITAVFFDSNDESIEVADSKKLLKYSLPNFKLLETSPLNEIISCTSMRKHKGIYYYSTMQMENMINDAITYADVIINKTGEYIPLFNKKINQKSSYFIPYNESFTINNNNELFVSLKYDNIFYQLKNGEIFPTFKVDFGKHGINNSIEKRAGNQQIYLYKNMTNKAAYPLLNIYNSDILMISYNFATEKNKNLKHYYFKIKNSEKIIHTKKFRNDLTNVPEYLYIDNNDNQINHESWYKNYLISIVWPHQVMIENTKYVEELGKVSLNDNPIIVLMKLQNSKL